MSQASLVRVVLNAVTFHDLLGPGDGVVVHCRGDAPGVALVHALADLDATFGFPLRLTLIHVTEPFSSEPTDTDTAAQVVARLAAERGAAVRLDRLDALPSDGANATDRRDALLARAAAEAGARAVAEATCADDRAEAALAAVLEGATSPAGLAGPSIKEPLPGASGVLVIRPFWRVRGAQIEQDLRARGIDPGALPAPPTNGRLRGRIRDELLPLLERRYNPRVRAALLRLADSARDAPPGD